jgi:hypothetical protein
VLVANRTLKGSAPLNAVIENTTGHGTAILPFVVPRACDFSIFSYFRHTQPAAFKPPDKAVILSEALRGSIANRGFLARSRRTPAMLVGRCSWEFSGRNVSIQQPLSVEPLPIPLTSRLPRRAVGAKPRDLQFHGPFLKMFFDRA